jgi:hypothetical protein
MEEIRYLDPEPAGFFLLDDLPFSRLLKAQAEDAPVEISCPENTAIPLSAVLCLITLSLYPAFFIIE